MFVVLAEAIAGVAATSSVLTDYQRGILVWFVVIYPILVFSCFVFLVMRHPGKLYGPNDFEDQAHFLQALGLKVESAIEKISYESEGVLAAIDIELIPIWEARSFNRPGDSERELHVLKESVEKLERKVAESNDGSKAAKVSALRKVYLQYLNQAREHYSSGAHYQEIKQHVIRGLEAIRRNEI